MRLIIRPASAGKYPAKKNYTVFSKFRPRKKGRSSEGRCGVRGKGSEVSTRIVSKQGFRDRQAIEKKGQRFGVRGQRYSPVGTV